ncbi:DUF6207 family protein [Streptomyces mirabilis]
MAGFDDDTVLAFQAAIARTWGTTTAERTTRDAGQPGVRAADVHRFAAGP